MEMHRKRTEKSSFHDDVSHKIRTLLLSVFFFWSAYILHNLATAGINTDGCQFFSISNTHWPPPVIQTKWQVHWWITALLNLTVNLTEQLTPKQSTTGTQGLTQRFQCIFPKRTLKESKILHIFLQTGMVLCYVKLAPNTCVFLKSLDCLNHT